MVKYEREKHLHTADDVPLEDVVENVEDIVDYFNNEAEVPFMDIFVDEVSQQTFIQEINEARPDQFEELAEGEFPGFQNDTSKPRYNELTIRTNEYGKSLGMTQKYVEDATSEQLQEKVEEVVDGATETMMDDVFDVIFNSVYDGSGGLWFEVPDYGAYQFDDTHSHQVPDTQALFNDIEVPDAAGDGYTAQQHIEAAAEHLRHHGWTTGQKVALVSKNWKFKIKDELTYSADYDIPMAENLRNTSIRDMDGPTPGGVTLMQSPYLTGDEFIIYDAGISPVKMYQDRELQLTQPSGGPVMHPGDIINGSATMSYGLANTNPLAMVEFQGVDVDWTATQTRY
jgi:hypothetical protein